MSMRLSWLARISITAKERCYNGLCKKYNDGGSNARSWLGLGLGKEVRVITPTRRWGWDVSGVGGLWMDQGHLWVVPMRKGDNSRDRQHPSRWESLNNQLASHTGVSLENQSGPSCHISKPVCKSHRCQLELAATLLSLRSERWLITWNFLFWKSCDTLCPELRISGKNYWGFETDLRSLFRTAIYRSFRGPLSPVGSTTEMGVDIGHAHLCTLQ